MTGYLLALDPGKSIGWATSAGDCGTLDLRAAWDADMAGACLAFTAWLDKHLPHTRRLIIERPFGLAGTTDIPQAMALTAHVAAKRHGVPRQEFTVASIRKLVCGRGNANKREVQAAVAACGYTFSDPHQADACALLEAAIRRAVQECAPVAAGDYRVRADVARVTGR
jgi:Holliday junction resolvasome RuvABC endonuclease subunit